MSSARRLNWNQRRRGRGAITGSVEGVVKGMANINLTQPAEKRNSNTNFRDFPCNIRRGELGWSHPCGVFRC